MKANLIKIALIVLSVLLVGLAIVNTYIGIMFFKLAGCNLFEKLDVVNQYDLFDKLFLGGYSVIISTVIFLVMLGLLIKIFIFKK